MTTDALSAHRRFDGGTVAALAAMAALAVAGVILAVRCRPPVSMRALRAATRARRRDGPTITRLNRSSPTRRPSRRRRGAGRALDVIDDRLGIKGLQYPVPEHANNLGWSLGGVTAFTLLVLIATGIFLTQWYNPVPEQANASVRYIVTNVWAGQFSGACTSGLRKRCTSW